MTKSWRCCQKRRASDRQDGNCNIRHSTVLGWLLSTAQLGRGNINTKANLLWLDFLLSSLPFNLPLEQLINLPSSFVVPRLCHENNTENQAFLVWF